MDRGRTIVTARDNRARPPGPEASKSGRASRFVGLGALLCALTLTPAPRAATPEASPPDLPSLRPLVHGWTDLAASAPQQPTRAELDAAEAAAERAPGAAAAPEQAEPEEEVDPEAAARRALQDRALPSVDLRELILSGTPSAALSRAAKRAAALQPILRVQPWDEGPEQASGGVISGLQEAIDQAPLGAALHLAPGVYTGPFEVTRAVSLIGGPGVELRAIGADVLSWRADGGRIAEVSLVALTPESAGTTTPVVATEEHSAKGAAKRERDAPAKPLEAHFGGIDLSAGAVALEDVALRSDAGPALHVRDGAKADVVGLSVLNTAASAVSVYRGGALRLVRAEISDAGTTAFEAFDNAVLELRASRILGGGAGLFAAKGADIALQDVIFRDQSSAGVGLGDRVSAIMRAVRIERSGDAGLLLGAGASAELSDSLIEDSALAGIEAREGAEIEARRVVVRGARQGGVLLRSGARGAFVDSLVLNSRLAGVEVRSGAEVELRGGEIIARHVGVYAHDGGAANLDGVRVSGFDRVGVEAADGGSATLRGVTYDLATGAETLARDDGRIEIEATPTAPLAAETDLETPPLDEATPE